MTPTKDAAVKGYDLMNGINARGSWLVSRFALPHLLESAERGNNPHILTLSPPLNFNTLSTTVGKQDPPAIFPYQFAQTASAYTIAKFGMSLLTLALAAETTGKVAVNSLWPYTLIATSAMKIVSKDASVQERKWRNPRHRRPSRRQNRRENAANFTAKFLVDELYSAKKDSPTTTYTSSTSTNPRTSTTSPKISTSARSSGTPSMQVVNPNTPLPS